MERTTITSEMGGPVLLVTELEVNLLINYYRKN
jgi:hypothetical protein